MFGVGEILAQCHHQRHPLFSAEQNSYRLLLLDGHVRVLRGVGRQLEADQFGAVASSPSPLPPQQMISEATDIRNECRRHRTCEVIDSDLLIPLGGKPWVQRHQPARAVAEDAVLMTLGAASSSATLKRVTSNRAGFGPLSLGCSIVTKKVPSLSRTTRR